MNGKGTAATDTDTHQGEETPGVNPLLAEWAAPYGLPPFADIRLGHFTPAFEAALAAHREEIAEITNEATTPTFANTLAALERSGRLLRRVSRVFFNLASCDSNDDLLAIERVIAPKLAEHQSQIFLNEALFQGIDALFNERGEFDLNSEDLRLLERTHLAFVRAGAQLDAANKARVAQILTRLASLTTQFTQNVLKDEQSWHLVLSGADDVSGLPPAVRAAARRAAQERDIDNACAVTLARSSVEAFLQFSERRDLRQAAYEAWISRGVHPGPTDNRFILQEIVALRSEFARVLGHATFAGFAVADTMAKTPLAVRQLLDTMWEPAVARAGRERSLLQDVAQKEGEGFDIAAWDWRYVAEMVRRARYEIDDSEVRPYLQLDNLISAAFDTAGRLFDLSFQENAGLERYHPDVRVWEVTDADGAHVGLFMGDYFARPSKQSGAWMSSFQLQSRLDEDVRPIILNVTNFARGGESEPCLLSFDDARTLFHEFGHALHGLLSNVTYPSFSGTNVARDFVELPSQLFEEWLMQPDVLKRFALHGETGEPMPDDLIARIQAARTFNQGFATVEYLASAIADLELHSLDDGKGLDVPAFERSILARIGMPEEIGMRHRLCHFGHIAGGYAAGYYSYLWSEVMAADAFAAFEEAGDLYDRATAQRLKNFIYSAGNKRDPEQAYIAFRGRPPEIDSLLRKRGFST